LGLHIITLHPNVEHALISHVQGENSESGIDWMFYAKGSEKQLLNVRNIFDGREGRGEILMRGIAEDHAHSICKGMIEIGLTGGGTNTYLTQEVLMLDATSKVDAIPALEIKTNDVKVSHSATVARVTEEDLFYFGARGIDPHEARRMFVLGFLGDITERIPDEKMREEVISAIEEKYQSA
jgi:Fe-S cluster assembly scaffold protein SufB